MTLNWPERVRANRLHEPKIWYWSHYDVRQYRNRLSQRCRPIPWWILANRTNWQRLNIEIYKNRCDLPQETSEMTMTQTPRFIQSEHAWNSTVGVAQWPRCPSCKHTHEYMSTHSMTDARADASAGIRPLMDEISNEHPGLQRTTTSKTSRD